MCHPVNKYKMLKILFDLFLLFKQLIDFGFAADTLPGHDFITRTFMGGTKDYLSPESLAAYYRVRHWNVNLTKLIYLM